MSFLWESLLRTHDIKTNFSHSRSMRCRSQSLRGKNSRNIWSKRRRDIMLFSSCNSQTLAKVVIRRKSPKISESRVGRIKLYKNKRKQYTSILLQYVISMVFSSFIKFFFFSLSSNRFPYQCISIGRVNGPYQNERLHNGSHRRIKLILPFLTDKWAKTLAID